MAQELIPADITDASDLLRLVEEVHESRQPRLLRRNGEDLAVLSPVPAPKKRRTRKEKTYTKEDDEAFLASAGGWKGLGDVDQFLKDNAKSRSISSRPPVEL